MITEKELPNKTVLYTYSDHICGSNQDRANKHGIMENHVFTYQNPIRSGIDPQGLRDCQILSDNGVWYLTGTAYPHWDRQ